MELWQFDLQISGRIIQFIDSKLNNKKLKRKQAEKIYN